MRQPLNFKAFESESSVESTPIVVVHGLFGSAGNWQSLARKLARGATTYSIDLRNHGESPHDPDVSFESMSDDLIGFMESHCINSDGVPRAHLIGHSMGGKVVMHAALTQPERVASMVAADIAPVAYQRGFRRFMDAMQQMPMEQITSRKQADEWLSDAIDEAGVRAFLLHNLRRNEDGQFDWRIGLDHLANGLETIAGFPDELLALKYTGPCLFLAGEQSTYIQESHLPRIQTLFPRSRHQVIANAGHWLHAEQPAATLDALEAFYLAEM